MSLALSLTRRFAPRFTTGRSNDLKGGPRPLGEFPAKRRVRAEVLYGILSGLLLPLSLPKPHFYPLAWIALVPWLFVILRDPNPRPVALVSYIAGFVFFTGTFYWMTETMIIYGGLSYVSAFGIGLLFAL